MRYRRIRYILCVFIGLLIYGLPVTGQQPFPSDYDPENKGWNGLSALSRLADRAKVKLNIVRNLNWAQVDPENILVFIYPKTPLNRDNIKRFLRDGGHVVIADDFGMSDDLLSDFGMKRVNIQEDHSLLYREDVFLPIILPREGHFLFWETPYLILNHPTSFQVSENKDVQVIATLDRSQNAVIVEVSLGAGQLLAVSDSSIFINLMLQFEGNQQFVANLFRNYCYSKVCQIDLVLPDHTSSGTYISRHPFAMTDFFKMIEESIVAINGNLARMADQGVPVWFMWTLIAGISGLFMIWLLWWLGRAGIPGRFSWEGKAMSVLSDMEQHYFALNHDENDTDFSEPAVMMIQETMTILDDQMPEGFEWGASVDHNVEKALEQLEEKTHLEDRTAAREALALLFGWVHEFQPSGRAF